jgi:hypothetical protein
MSRFSYLLPKVDKSEVNPTLLEKRGLADRLWDVMGRRWSDQLSVQNWSGGEGLSGALVTPATGDFNLLKPGQFSHHKSSVGDYVILWGERPTPEGLKRARQCEGVACELGDTEAWTVPIIRQRLSETLLPKSWGMGEGCTIVEAVEERFQALWNRSASWLPWMISDKSAAEFFGAGAWMAATLCLAVNYRIGIEESLLLRLWNTASVEEAMAAAMDRDWYQKKSEDGSAAAACRVLESLLHGPEDSTPTTGQAESTTC